MATFAVRFLGCKVSHTDAQEIRDRLLRDGHTESGQADVAVVNACCVTNEAVSKSRKEASRAAYEECQRLERALAALEADGQVARVGRRDGRGRRR